MTLSLALFFVAITLSFSQQCMNYDASYTSINGTDIVLNITASIKYVDTGDNATIIESMDSNDTLMEQTMIALAVFADLIMFVVGFGILIINCAEFMDEHAKIREFAPLALVLLVVIILDFCDVKVLFLDAFYV